MTTQFTPATREVTDTDKTLLDILVRLVALSRPDDALKEIAKFRADFYIDGQEAALALMGRDVEKTRTMNSPLSLSRLRILRVGEIMLETDLMQNCFGSLEPIRRGMIGHRVLGPRTISHDGADIVFRLKKTCPPGYHVTLYMSLFHASSDYHDHPCFGQFAIKAEAVSYCWDEYEKMAKLPQNVKRGHIIAPRRQNPR